MIININIFSGNWLEMLMKLRKGRSIKIVTVQGRTLSSSKTVQTNKNHLKISNVQTFLKMWNPSPLALLQNIFFL